MRSPVFTICLRLCVECCVNIYSNIEKMAVKYSSAYINMQGEPCRDVEILLHFSAKRVILFL